MNTVSTKSRDTFEYSKVLRAETHVNTVSTKSRDTFEDSKY